MAGTVISNKLPPNIDITKAPLAYGKRALPKLVSCLVYSSRFLVGWYCCEDFVVVYYM